SGTGAARKPTERPSIVHSSLYLPEPVYEVLRKIAFEERLKIHGVVLEGIDLALRRRGYASIESRRAGKRRERELTAPTALLPGVTTPHWSARVERTQSKTRWPHAPIAIAKWIRRSYGASPIRCGTVSSPCRGGAYRAILSKPSGRLGSGLRRLLTPSRRLRSEKARRMLRVELLAKSGSYWIGFATRTTLRPSVRRGYASSNTS